MRQPMRVGRIDPVRIGMQTVMTGFASNERANFSRIDPAPIPRSPADDFAFRMNDLAPPALLLRPSLVHHRQEDRDAPCPIFRHQAQGRMENSRRLSLLGSLSNQTESPAGGHRLCRARRPSRTRGAGARARRGSPVRPAWTYGRDPYPVETPASAG